MQGAFAYSGRGMMGRRCLAFRTLADLIVATRANPRIPTAGWLTDSMGLEEIYYHPELPAPPIPARSPEEDDGA